MGPAPAALSLAGLPQRIRRRITELGPTDVSAYRADLEFHPGEWAAFDALCRIPISRFARDRDVFEHLRQVMLPAAAQRALDRRDDALRCWSAGCASGEAAYTLRIPWDLDLAPRSPGLPLRIVATDVDESLLERARRACYDASSLKDLPADWVARAFTRSGGLYCLGGAFRQGVESRRQDLRAEVPDEPFHRILCRNLVCTYFEDTLQRAVLRRVLGRLIPGGFIVIGKHEALPAGLPALVGCPGRLGIYRKAEAHVGGVDDPAAETLSRPGSGGPSRVI